MQEPVEHLLSKHLTSVPQEYSIVGIEHCLPPFYGVEIQNAGNSVAVIVPSVLGSLWGHNVHVNANLSIS